MAKNNQNSSRNPSFGNIPTPPGIPFPDSPKSPKPKKAVAGVIFATLLISALSIGAIVLIFALLLR